MTTEDAIMEILYQSDKKGIRIKVLDKVSLLMNANPTISRIDAYEQAYNSFTEK